MLVNSGLCVTRSILWVADQLDIPEEYAFIFSITHLSLHPFLKENLKVLSLLHFREQGSDQLGSLGCPGQKWDV